MSSARLKVSNRAMGSVIFFTSDEEVAAHVDSLLITAVPFIGLS